MSNCIIALATRRSLTIEYTRVIKNRRRALARRKLIRRSAYTSRLTFLRFHTPQHQQDQTARAQLWREPLLSLRIAMPTICSALLVKNPTTEPDADIDALAALVAKFAARDSLAFESFYALTLPTLLGLVRRIVGTNFTEDVLAEAYFQAWRDANAFDAKRGNAMAWIITIARSRALDRLRQERSRHGGMVGAPSPEPETAGDETIANVTPQTLLEDAQSRSALHAALRQLSSNERWCLGLAYYRDLSHSEISHVTLLPLGTVKSLITRAQQKLRALLSSAPDTPSDRSFVVKDRQI